MVVAYRYCRYGLLYRDKYSEWHSNIYLRFWSTMAREKQASN
jgi:hypothetical protein